MTTKNTTRLDKECKELFEWIAHWNYEVNGRQFPTMPETEKMAIRTAMKKMQSKCQKVNTEYCKCDCGKHKENGDYC